MPEGLAAYRCAVTATATPACSATTSAQLQHGCARWVHLGWGRLVGEAILQAGGRKLRLCGRLCSCLPQVWPDLQGVSRLGTMSAWRLLRVPRGNI